MTSPSDILKGKTALITGSNRGIGKAITEKFAENGADILACVRKESVEFLAFIRELSSKHGVIIKTVCFDLSDEIQIKESLSFLIRNKVPIDILVNNAGIHHKGLLQMTPISKIKEVFEVNFFAQLKIIQLISRIMMHRKSGNIINIASASGIESYPGYSAYGTSKAALLYATQVLAKELASYNIRVNAIAPGLTDTDMLKELDQEAVKSMLCDGSVKKVISASEVAGIALFLASDLSSDTNGQIIRLEK
jgi:3-oxoacyl-[acyl-carrier protein] reductase